VLGAPVNSVTYYRLWAAHTIEARTPVALSLIVAALVTLVGAPMLRPTAPPTRRGLVMVMVVASALFVASLPLLQMTFFGTTDYRRPAQAVVVFERVGGAEWPGVVRAGGQGRHGHGAVPGGARAHDRDVRRCRAVDTLATVDDTARIFERAGIDRVLVVSQYYHLPRIKLAYSRAGYDVWTVPSRDTPIRQSSLLVAREIPAFWLYYLRVAFT
jgi:hypothetical protein